LYRILDLPLTIESHALIPLRVNNLHFPWW
jgi:hypothetical protein